MRASLECLSLLREKPYMQSIYRLTMPPFFTANPYASSTSPQDKEIRECNLSTSNHSKFQLLCMQNVQDTVHLETQKAPITQLHPSSLFYLKCKHSHKQLQYRSKEKNPSWVVLKSWAFKTFLANKTHFVHSTWNMPRGSWTQLDLAYKVDVFPPLN